MQTKNESTLRKLDRARRVERQRVFFIFASFSAPENELLFAETRSRFSRFSEAGRSKTEVGVFVKLMYILTDISVLLLGMNGRLSDGILFLLLLLLTYLYHFPSKQIRRLYVLHWNVDYTAVKC